MCDEYNNNKPLGSQEAENAWYEHKRKSESAMSSDIYTNGGLLDRYNAMGYEQPMFYPSTIQQLLEKDFSYEELKFIAGARLMHMSMADIDRLISLLEKLKKSIKNIPTNGLPTPVTPSTPSWNNPYYGFGGGVQPLYGCPIPQDQRILNDKYENDLWTKKWGNLGEETGFDLLKDKEEDDKKEEEKIPSFLGAAWNDQPVRTKMEKFYSSGTPFPEKIGEKKGSHKRTVILSPEVVSSKDDSSLAKVVIDGPSTGIAINDNPVPLTENKSVDEENKD